MRIIKFKIHFIIIFPIYFYIIIVSIIKINLMRTISKSVIKKTVLDQHLFSQANRLYMFFPYFKGIAFLITQQR